MTTRRSTAPAAADSAPETSVKLRQTQAEYTAARPSAEPGIRRMDNDREEEE